MRNEEMKKKYVYVVKENFKGFYKQYNNGKRTTDLRHCDKFKTKIGAFIHYANEICNGAKIIKVLKPRIK